MGKGWQMFAKTTTQFTAQIFSVKPRTSFLSSGKSDIVRRGAMNFSSTPSPGSCEADILLRPKTTTPLPPGCSFSDLPHHL